jgi:predicted TPR repeat methyltransferase
MAGEDAGEPVSAAAALAAAIGLHRSGELEQAEAIYLALLEADPNDAEALHYLGVARHQQGESLLAVDLVRRALEIRPGYADAFNNLGNILQQLGAFAEAAAAYRKALELRDRHPGALHNLGIALRKLKRFEEAAELHRRAIEQEPGNLQSHYSLANAYKDMGRIEDALATLRTALALRPETEGFRRIGQLLYGLRRTEEAAANYEAWLRAEPGNPVAEHMLAACTLKDVPARAGDAFVTRVFDGFAESFDEVLERLEYRAPALVGQVLRRFAGEARGALDIVDAGCGTGLLAEHLRPYARALVGVDLSPGMLRKAARRGVYDRLEAAELSAFLGSAPEAFDVVASSDTLVYFGDLREVFGAAETSLRRGGWLFFTLEHAGGEDEVPEGFRIHPHGRYSHTERYVRAALAEAGFEVAEIERAHLRREGRFYVNGLVVAARRAAGSVAA